MGQESNPFYISPGVADVAPFMSGIGSLIKQSRDKTKNLGFQKEFAKLLDSGTPEDVFKFRAANPQADKLVGDVMGFRDNQTKQNLIDTSMNVLNDREGAEGYLTDRIEFVKSRGGDPDETIKDLETLRTNPELYFSNVEKELPYLMSKQQYEVYKDQTGIGLNNIDAQKLQLERDKFNQKMGIDKRIQSRKDDGLKLSKLKAKQDLENNKQVREKRELEIEKLTNGIAQKKSDIKAGYQSSLATSDSTIGYIDKLLDHPGLDKSVGVDAAFFTAPGSDAANFEALLESFDAKLFSTAIKQMVGMGSLSDAEGKKISASVGALSPKMSNEAFRESLNDIKREMNAARQRTVDRMNPEDKPAGEQDSEAVAWAKANPDDPRAAQIMKAQGAQ